MPSVLIFLAVYQGEQFLVELLQSLTNQTVKEVHILASDDGSTDRSVEILRKAQKSWKKGTFEIVEGPQNGFANNFRAMLLQTEIRADYYAFCDQDDVWDANRLERGLIWHEGLNIEVPAVFGSRPRLIDASNRVTGLAKLMNKPPSFQHALAQNLLPGHTMLFNNATRNLLVKTADYIGKISHDYWTYLIVTGVGGGVHYSLKPTVSYRQHETNVIGVNVSLLHHLWRFKRVARGDVRRRSALRIKALEECWHILTPSAQSSLQHFRNLYYSNSAIERMDNLAKSGIYRQSRMGRLALKVDCFFGQL